MRQSRTSALLLGTMLFACTVAHAQYAWIDPKGVRQYSDQPPPTDTPAAKILKTPRGVAPPADAAPAATPAPAKASTSLVDREADYRKRQALAQENDAKAATENKNAAAQRANCELAKAEKEKIDSGRRMRTEQNVVMTEEDKARQLAEIAKIMKDCK